MTESTSAEPGWRTLAVDRHSAAPVETVWALLADARSYRSWSSFTSTSLEREGVPAPDGVGAIRRFGYLGLGSREEVVAFDPPHHLAYELRSGLPVADYRADVTLTAAADGGTDIAWRSRYRTPRPPGALWAGIIRRAVTQLATALARAADERAR